MDQCSIAPLGHSCQGKYRLRELLRQISLLKGGYVWEEIRLYLILRKIPWMEQPLLSGNVSRGWNMDQCSIAPPGLFLARKISSARIVGTDFFTKWVMFVKKLGCICF
ncbi:hypothetical protein CEXT_443681 [Caerostris extrusa]|uniref:Uncharacterized protein n=1 Tax=Caerostris extrusa TaxID=172846 RepID=A0AAV4WZI7_CAEEX|nr:hypothetical protein CEXT_443681 [Caerostris extrusa]